MIKVKLNGGLGNQMFQYAAARRLAEHHKTFLKAFFVSTMAGDTKRQYDLGCFHLTPEFSVTSLSRYEIKIRAMIGKLIPIEGEQVTEKSFHFDPAILSLPDGVTLNGYWQSEKYFKDVEDLIRSDFEFKSPLTRKNAQIAKRIKACNSISLHIRRGDYAYDPKTNAFHGLINLDYYHRALAYIESKSPQSKVFVFSDDIDWVRKSLKLPKAEYIDWNQGNNSFKDMQLMSLCNYNIIANSSFSWWGAWLNSNPKKIIIAPRQWFKDQTIDTKDLIPTGWIKL